MQTVSSYQRKEGRQEATTVRAETFFNQVMELIDLHTDEAQAEQERHRQPADNCTFLLFVHVDNCKTIGNGAQQKQGGFHQDERQFKDIFPCRATRGVVYHYTIGRKQRCEDDAVTHQVDPEAEDFIGSCIVMPMLRMGVVVFSHSFSRHFSDLLC
ncbi:Uncharacterised protein [Klebsiella pneumoniae]|nr:Uncharacterised protein [Klebsiella pneumoniae]